MRILSLHTVPTPEGKYFFLWEVGKATCGLEKYSFDSETWKHKHQAKVPYALFIYIKHIYIQSKLCSCMTSLQWSYNHCYENGCPGLSLRARNWAN